jgi:hypothetical protein
MCRWRAIYCWKALDKGYNFALDFTSIKGLHSKLCGPKVVRVPTSKISGLPFGSPETKCHLDVSLVERHKVYYKGEGGGFPQVWAVVSFVSSSLLVVHPNTINAPTMHEPTCCLVLCKSMWVIKCLSIFLVPSWSSNMPLYLQSAACQGAREHVPTPYSSVVFTLDSHLSLSRSLGVCHVE